jgi:hypothetical protein
MSSDASPSFSAVLGEVGLLGAYGAALAYVAGWSYADRYFAELGIGLSELDGFGAEDIAVYALHVFQDGWLASLASLSLAIVLVAGLWRQRRRLGPDAAVVATVLIALVSLVGAAHLGSSRALAQVDRLFESAYRNFPRVAVLPKPDSPAAIWLGEGNHVGDSTCLRKIFADRTHLYVYYGVRRPNAARPDVLVLPRDQLAATRVVLGNRDLCEP